MLETGCPGPSSGSPRFGQCAPRVTATTLTVGKPTPGDLHVDEHDEVQQLAAFEIHREVAPGGPRKLVNPAGPMKLAGCRSGRCHPHVGRQLSFHSTRSRAHGVGRRAPKGRTPACHHLYFHDQKIVGLEMRITFVADYRSPIARQWIDQISIRHTVQVISSYPIPLDVRRQDIMMDFEPLGLAAVAQARLIGLSRYQHRQFPSGTGRPLDMDQPGFRITAGLSSANVQMSALINWVGPFEMLAHVRQLKSKIESFRPDLVHAMRIPYEGMVAARSVRQFPLVTSIWGNDLTLYGSGNRWMARQIRRTLQSTDALHTDCERDLRLAGSWGWDSDKPSVVIPGSGGVDLASFHPGPSPIRGFLGIPEDASVILNPRGVRAYTYTMQFLDAAEALLAARRDIHVICTGMVRHGWIRDRVAQMPGSDRVHLLPALAHTQMPEVYRSANVVASLTSHDGSPNSLLEGLASGCLPVVAPVDSVLEWVEDGVNGLVVNPTDMPSLVDALIRSVDDHELQLSAQNVNLAIARDRANLTVGVGRAAEWYESILH